MRHDSGIGNLWRRYAVLDFCFVALVCFILLCSEIYTYGFQFFFPLLKNHITFPTLKEAFTTFKKELNYSNIEYYFAL